MCSSKYKLKWMRLLMSQALLVRISWSIANCSNRTPVVTFQSLIGSQMSLVAKMMNQDEIWSTRKLKKQTLIHSLSTQIKTKDYSNTNTHSRTTKTRNSFTVSFVSMTLMKQLKMNDLEQNGSKKQSYSTVNSVHQVLKNHSLQLLKVDLKT